MVRNSKDKRQGQEVNKPLILVESPAKAKTIANYLGGQFNVIATKGHLIDLPKNRLGVNTEYGYAQEFVRIKGKSSLINQIKKAVKQAPKVYLAQDPDREGEAIAWQVIYLANNGKLATASKPKTNKKTSAKQSNDKKGASKNVSARSISQAHSSQITTQYKLSDIYPDDPKFARIVFHEITKQAIQKAMEAPGKLDVNLVEAQKARRVLDRLVGYPLSELLWHKIRYGLSAGRVQSAALRLIVERQELIDAFVPQTYYNVAILTSVLPFYLSDLKTLSKKNLTKQQLDLVKKALQDLKEVTIKTVQSKKQQVSPPAPFTTSTLQQIANKTFGFSAKTTMRIAQELYQGMDIPKLGRKALITYMRTDSVHLSDFAIKSAREYIQSNIGQDYLNPDIRRYKTKAKLAQEAHEAIRPVSISITPEQLKGKIPETHYKLYTLIWKRTIATQMKPAEYTTISAELDKSLETEDKHLNNSVFVAKEKYLSYEGYLKVYGKIAGELDKSNKDFNNIDTAKELVNNKKLNLEKIKALQTGESIRVHSLKIEEFQTKPKPQYTDATLVKMLEKLGIGRPSTFASIIDTLIRRGYVERQGKFLIPTDTGKLVLKFLKEHFPQIVDYDFTAQMENGLDKIAQGKLDKISFLNDFYPNFIKRIQEKEQAVQKQDLVVLEKTDKVCPKCGAPMVLKLGRYGKFYSCSRFPECDGMLPYIDENKYVIPEKAKTGEWVLKAGPYGKFWAHKDYPKIKETAPLLLKETCPKCGAHLVERKGKNGRIFIACSAYPKCKYVRR